MTCCPEAKTDETKRAGVCLACSLHCHENHDLIELYTKRNFRCDCGNPKFGSQSCTFTPEKNDLNYDNRYNQNFSGVYCICHRPYPDPEATEEEEMIQCVVCEDWLHENHLEATVPNNDQYGEMVCKACMEDNDFLHDYSDIVINIVDKEIIVSDPDLDISIDDMKTNGDLNTDQISNEAPKDDEDSVEDSNQLNLPKNQHIEEKTGTEQESDGKPESENENKVETATDDNKEEKSHAELLFSMFGFPNTEFQRNTEDKMEAEAVGDNTESLGKGIPETNDMSLSDTVKEDTLVDDISKQNAVPDSETVNEEISGDKDIPTPKDVTSKEEETEKQKESVKPTKDIEMKEAATNSIESKSENYGIDAVLDDTDSKVPKESIVDKKRKIENEEVENHTAKKLKSEDTKPCKRPRGVKGVLKGATFWPVTFRQKLCTCGECISMYKDLGALFLIDPEDTVTAYETLGKENAEGPSSQYEKGLQALSSLDRVQQINAMTEYNKMRDKLLDFLKSFKDRREIVKEEDIKAFFAGMKPKREPDGVYFCR